MKNAGEFAGFGLEHSFESFNKLIKEFKYLDNPFNKDYITCKQISDKLVYNRWIT